MVQDTPDPPKEEMLVSADDADVMIPTDSDDEVEINDGYSMLPTEIDDGDDSSEEEEDESAEVPVVPSIVPFQRPVDDLTREEIKAIWCANNERIREALDPLLRDQVLNAMKDFQLPPASFPPWAKDVCEEDWKNHLFKIIRIEKVDPK